ncbi:hypothetical protein WJX75_006974 [Coccomyxa subellipsoidea]|uniref:Uncharacterized protein n=1 Tax=Coccomyxa subellipsoidea TaxID=248742 RepID=A0ABR2YCJ1_9CHLO
MVSASRPKLHNQVRVPESACNGPIVDTSPSPAPGQSPPLPQGLTTEVVIALAVACFLLVGLFIGVARFLFLHLYRFETRAAEAAAADAAAAADKEVDGAMKHLQRVTPVIVIQPDQEILYGRKERPNIGEGSPEVHISVESILPPQQPREGTKTPKGADNTRNFYVVEIPDLSEPSFPQDNEAGEVLQKIQLAKHHVRAHVCRDSVSSCQA